MIKGRKPAVAEAEDHMIIDGPIFEDMAVLRVDAPNHLIFQKDMAPVRVNIDDPVSVRAIGERSYAQVGLNIRISGLVCDVIPIRAEPTVIGGNDESVISSPFEKSIDVHRRNFPMRAIF
jgi:hypothetical protein